MKLETTMMLLTTALLTACATASHDERSELLDRPIDCATAEQDIADLEAALPSGFERGRSVVQSVAPIGIVTGAVKRENVDKVKVASGRTGAALEGRIIEIERACGSVQETPR